MTKAEAMQLKPGDRVRRKRIKLDPEFLVEAVNPWGRTLLVRCNKWAFLAGEIERVEEAKLDV